MHSASASSPLPHHVDAVKLCQQGGHLSGSASFAQLHRLGDQLCHQNGQAQVDWQFSLDEQSRKVIHGTVTAVLPLVCQRCLEQVDVAVQADTSLALVWSDEQAAQLSRSLDPVLMENDVLDVLATVEDGLLLALPIVATHEKGVCEIGNSLKNFWRKHQRQRNPPIRFRCWQT
ncbi:MAG: YceD family protein [Pseudomonadales bacterium]